MNTGPDTSQQSTPGSAAPGPSPLSKGVASGLKRLYELSVANSHIILLVSALMLLVSAYLALVYAPEVEDDVPVEDRIFVAPKSQRIFYLHVPAAWVALLAFTLVFVASMLFLKTRTNYWDHLAYAAAEVGVLFCTVAIVTGPFWAKAEWGEYWRNDPKLNVTFVLWLIYIGYLVFRSSSEEDDAALASILSIFGMITIPMTFLASRWRTSSHPDVVGKEGSLGGDVVFALVFSVFAFTLLFYFLLVKRFALVRMKHRLEELKSRIGVMLHG